MVSSENAEALKSAADYAAATSALGAFFGWITMPNIAALLTIGWLGFRLLNEIHKWRTRNDPKFFNRRKGD